MPSLLSFPHAHGSRSVRLRWLLAIAVACLATGPAWAQTTKFRELPVDESMKSRKADVTRALRSSSPTSEQTALVDTYLKTYAIPRWTVVDNGPSLPGYRAELLKDLAVTQGQMRQWINGKVLGYLLNIGRSSQYSMPCRYNMILAAGALNDQEGASRSDPPTPMARALPELMKLYENADDDVPDALRFAALLGILRHAQLGGIPKDYALATVIPAMVDLATTTAPTGLRSPEVHEWFRIRAIETISAIGQIGTQGEVVATLMGIINDKEDAVNVRNTATRALGNMDYQSGQLNDPTPLVAAVSKLALDACQRVRDEIQLELDLGLTTSSSSYDGDDEEDDSSGDEEEDDSSGGGASFGLDRDITAELEARKMLDYRRSVKAGLGAVLDAIEGTSDQRTGLLGFVKGSPLEAQLTKLQEGIDDLVGNIDHRDLETVDQLYRYLELAIRDFGGSTNG